MEAENQPAWPAPLWILNDNFERKNIVYLDHNFWSLAPREEVETSLLLTNWA